MCAIVGSNFIPNISFEYLLKTLSNRGPDNQSFKIYQDIFLAHGRLSIIDLDNKANQPMEFDDIIIVFNGEIYNYKELIKKYNLNVATKSDTEVIIRLYQTLEFDFMKELNGAFSFCIYDKKNKRFFCARDRFGKKPFYYHYKKNRFIFSSTIKTIIDILGKTPNFNKNALNEYLSFFAPISDITFYENIYKLPKSSYLVFENDKLFIKKYYKIKTKKYIFNEDIAIKNIEDELIKAISLRLNSDVDIGVLLSGGIDSSLIATLYSNITGKKIKTFSVGFDKYKKYDELNYAKIVAKTIKSEHFEIEVNKNDFIETFENIFNIIDEPFGDTSIIPLYLLGKTIKYNNIKTVFGGEGSDELFLGYEKYFKMLEFYSFKKTLTKEQLSFFKKNIISFNKTSKESLYFKRVIFGEAIYQSFGETFSYEQKKDIFNKHIKGIKFSEDSDKIDYMSKLDLNIWIGDVLVQKLDKALMANGIENRNPFLDKNLIDLVFKIDSNLKVKSQKYLLKQIANKYIPDIIIKRVKKGFNSPFNEILFDEYKDNLLDIILLSNKNHNLFKEKSLKQLFLLAKNNKFRQHFYLILLFSKWFLKNY